MRKYKILQNKIDKKLTYLSNKKNCNYFGRANSAIWCIAEFLKKSSHKRTIIMPSTMCISPAIIFKILGFKIEFIDVNKKDGLLSLEKIIKKTKNKNHDILSIFYVNLFGNKDIKAHKLKKIKNIFIIQDLAQTFFCKENIKKDIFGDLVILSFGYSKIFDLGHGGIVLSNNKEFHSYGFDFNKKIKNTRISNIGKRMYMKWYSNVVERKLKFSIRDIKAFASKIYLIKFDQKKLSNIYSAINSLSKEYKRRILLFKFFKKKIKNPSLNVLHSEDVFTPWRFSFLIKKKNYFLHLIRKSGFDASSYYPNIGRIFADKLTKNSYPNSDLIQKEIINLWLTKEYNKNRINKICKILNEK